MFNDKQLQALAFNLDASRVKTINKAGMEFQYLETYDVINVANTIFSYMWDYTITRLDEVAREVNQNSNYVITYSGIVKVRIYDNQRNFIEREDTGIGIGTAKNLGEAIDNASKSAVSDALKRSLRSLGRQFGNDLYSKSPSLNYSQHQPQNYPLPNQEQTNDGFDYSSLYRLGLELQEGNGELIIIGETYGKQDAIKAIGGFRWDGRRKLWRKQLHQQVA